LLRNKKGFNFKQGIAPSITASKSKQVLHHQKPIEQRQPVLFERDDRVPDNEIVMGTVW